MIEETHHGEWQGPNRLWLEDPTPERSDGRLQVEARRIRYTWAFRGEAQQGDLELFGPPGAVRAAWTDTMHAGEGMALHGACREGTLVLYGTYPAGDGPEWGWRIEVDTRDPEHLDLRMFNLFPDGQVMPAVALTGSR